MSKKPDLFHEKKSQLSMAHTIQLADWMRQQELVDVTCGQLADRAAAALGFRVTANNIKGALRATGLSIITPLEQAEDQAARDLATVAKVVADLLDELGHPVPEPLAKIAGIEG